MLSFIIPCYNEEESLRLLHEGIVSNVDDDYEIIFVNDGSTDKTVDVIKEIHQKDNKVHLLSFRKNFGKAAALQAGFRNCKGDIVFTMDADLQDDPSEISNFVEKINEGNDLVSGWKFDRQDPLEKRLPSKLFNKVVSMISGVKLHDYNCGFKAYRREVVKSLDIYGELHRFVPVLASRKGFRIAEIKVKHNKRQFGKSKYGFERYLRGFFDAITVLFLSKYYDRPMHLFGRLGLVSMLIGGGICLYLLILWLLGTKVGGRPLLTVGVLGITTGIQFFSIGILGDMIVENSFRSRYDESHIDEKF